jgi:hypothetical protein
MKIRALNLHRCLLGAFSNSHGSGGMNRPQQAEDGYNHKVKVLRLPR